MPTLLRASGIALLVAVCTTASLEPGRWEVVALDRYVALGQTALGRSGYRLAVRTDVALADVHAGVRLRMATGDKAAGLAWRVQDAGNYFAARLDFDTNEVVLYKFVRGHRIRLDRRTGLRLDARAWHELSIEHGGSRVRVWLNGVPVAHDRDDTPPVAGTVGFWMPGDGTAHFERLWYRPLDEPQ